MGLEVNKITALNNFVYTNSLNRRKSEFEPLYTFNEQARVQKNNTSKVKENIQKALEDGSLIYHKGEKNIIFPDKEAEYEYKANGKETIRDIKKKFGLKDGSIKRCNPNIMDDDWLPPKGHEIFFYEKDVNSK